MAQMTITIPDEFLSEVLAAFEQQFNYEQNKEASETKAQFAKRMVITKFMKKVLENYLSIKGAELARIEASKDVDLMIQ